MNESMDDIREPAPAEPFTIGEGRTPLVRSRSIGPAAGLKRLYFKLESTNPTGSYKDRFAAAAIADMLSQGQTRCLGTSSGNTGAALAACCAAAGISCALAIIEGAPRAKLAQMLAYGATLVRVRGFGPDPTITAAVLETVRRAADTPQSALQVSAYRYSPVGMSGVESIADEITEQCEHGVDHVLCPAGGGGLALAIARGVHKLVSAARLTKPVRVHCVQPEGNDTIATALRRGQDRARAVHCKTSISGLQVPSVIDGDQVIKACRASGGTGYVVTDAEVYSLQRRLAREEGIFCEPAGAVALAGALQALRLGEVSADETTVCLVTGTGFKDPPSLDRMTEGRTIEMVEADALIERLCR